jgi:hypothetical protein
MSLEAFTISLEDVQNFFMSSPCKNEYLLPPLSGKYCRLKYYIDKVAYDKLLGSVQFFHKTAQEEPDDWHAISISM